MPAPGQLLRDNEVTTLNLTELKQITAAQDEAQRKAAPAIKDAHEKAHTAAQELASELTVATGEGQRREALRKLCETAAGERYKTKADKQQAGLILGQHAASVGDQNGVPQSASRDGRYIAQHAVSGTASYSPEQRAKVLAAIVIGALGETETGLIEFPQDWHNAPSLAALEQMAGILDAEAMDKLNADHQAASDELAEATRLMDALAQATPKLFALLEGDEGLEVEVVNKRGGSIGMPGFTFESGVNKLTSDEFAKVRNNSTFKAYEEKGLLVIAQTSQLVEEL